MAIEKAEHGCADFRATLGDDVRPRLPFIAAQHVCRGIPKIVHESCSAARKPTLVAGDNQHPRGQTGERSRVQDRRRDQCQGRDPLRVEGRQAMPIPKWRRTAGGDMGSPDAEMSKQI
jgi:hypothetical protein